MISICFPHYLTQLDNNELADRIQKLNNCCLNQSPENHCTKSKKDKELQLMTEIINKSSISQLHAQDPRNLISCAIEILLKYSNAQTSPRKSKSRYQTAKDNYKKLLKIFAAQGEEIAKIVIDVIHNKDLWPRRRVCVDVVASLLESDSTGVLVHHEICNKIESKDAGVKPILKVLYELLDTYAWPETEETVGFLERLLGLYYKSLHDASTDPSENALFAGLRGSLELCLRHAIQNTSNSQLLVIIQRMAHWSIQEAIDDDAVLNYGSTLEYAAYMHRGDSLANTLTSEILRLLMQMIGSPVRFVSLLGNRVLQHLVDRGDNKALFSMPKIFFEDMQLNLKISEHHREDKMFLRQHREIIHCSLTKSVINHRSSRLNLETTYCTICLLAIEIPCGFTAAALCCLMMNLQDVIMKQPERFG